MHIRTTLVTVALLLVPAAARADVKPNALCGEGMVLQQQAKVKIWGTADKGERVTVQFRDQNAVSEADGDGHWSVTLDSGAAGGPLPMTIAGKDKLVYKNVFVGEVWVCSGQSNMEMAVGNCNQSDREIARTTQPNPMLRLFTVKKNAQATPTDRVEGSWVAPGPETVNSFSAVGYFFGRDLQKALKVPVGLIHTSWGGTRAEAWTSQASLDARPEFKHEHETFGKLMDRYKNDPEGLLKEQQAAARAGNRPEPKTVQSPVHQNAPSVLYNGMIHPLLNYTIKGAIWYQGEANAGQAYAYRTLFPLMIEDWRKNWKESEFPFLFVQLAPFTAVATKPGDSRWAELREAQMMTLKLPHTGMAVITDCGDETDIHPTPKQPVGERLSLIARATVYGDKAEFSGPVFKEMKVEGDKAILTFTHADGLEARNLLLTERDQGGHKHKEWRIKEGSAALLGFTVGGADHKFQNARAEIVGDKVVVRSDAVASPVAVRYGWAEHPVCNLYNKAGLPASPFRTDDFPGITAPKKN